MLFRYAASAAILAAIGKRATGADHLSPRAAGLSGEKIRESYQTLGVLEFVAVHQHARLETTKVSHMNHLSPFPGQPCACGERSTPERERRVSGEGALPRV